MMSPIIRNAFLTVAALAGACALPATAAEQGSFPNRALRLIVPYASGGIVDYVGRLMGQRLSETFSQNVVIDNRPGAGGVIGIEAATKASADGQTMVIMDPAIVINPSLMAKVPYDLNRDLVPLTIMTTSPLVLVVSSKVPATSMQELIALAKTQPGKIGFASAGIGTTPHMAGELFKARIQQNIVHIPYKGSGPAMTDLIAGQVQISFSSVTAALPFIKDQRLRALATTGDKRVNAMSGVPTMIEAGYPGFEVNLWLGMFVPSQTPKDIVNPLNAELKKALQAPNVAAGLEKVGADPLGNTPEQAAAYVRNESAKWAKVVKDANLRAE